MEIHPGTVGAEIPTSPDSADALSRRPTRPVTKGFGGIPNARPETLNQLGLGYCLQTGEGVPEKPEEAVHWYELAADQDNAWAPCNRGMCYEDWQGVPADEDEPRHWHGLAALCRRVR